LHEALALGQEDIAAVQREVRARVLRLSDTSIPGLAGNVPVAPTLRVRAAGYHHPRTRGSYAPVGPWGRFLAECRGTHRGRGPEGTGKPGPGMVLLGAPRMQRLLRYCARPLFASERWSGRSGASAQSAAEAAIKLHPDVKDRLADIGKIVLASQKPALRIIDKQGRLANPADRDHCLQYVVAIGLLFGELHYHHFEDEVAADPRIDAKSHFLSSPVLATPVGSRYLFPFLVAFEVAPKEEGGDLFFQCRQL